MSQTSVQSIEGIKEVQKAYRTYEVDVTDADANHVLMAAPVVWDDSMYAAFDFPH